MAIAYMNGEWLPVQDAKVSVLDRGFLFGDGVYEVVPVYQGKLFCLDRHIARLMQSLSEIYLDVAYSKEQWSELLCAAVAKSGESLASLYLQVTRGADTSRTFVYPVNPEPTVFIMVNPAPQLARQEIIPQKMITLEDFRWHRGHIKTISLIAAGMLKNQAIAAGAQDAILVKNGFVTESTAANVFAVINGIIVTPPRSLELLHGITRDVIVELVHTAGIKLEERALKPEELKLADEIFVTSSTQEAWPVGQLDGVQVGNGEAGLVWRSVDELFQQAKLAAA